MNMTKPKISPELADLFAKKLLRVARPLMGIDDKGRYTVVHWCRCTPYCDEFKENK